MKNFLIKDVLTTGWEQFRKRSWYLAGLSVAFTGMFIASASTLSPVTALSYILYGGFLSVLLKHYHGGWIKFDDLFDIDKRWIYFAFLGLLKMFVIAIGLVFFILPGVYLAVRLMFAELLVIDKGMRPFEAMQASYDMTKNHFWKLLLVALVFSLLAILGLMFFLVGVFVAVLVIQFATIKIYYNLKD
jgi:hypothetical protein